MFKVSLIFFNVMFSFNAFADVLNLKVDQPHKNIKIVIKKSGSNFLVSRKVNNDLLTFPLSAELFEKRSFIFISSLASASKTNVACPLPSMEIKIKFNKNDIHQTYCGDLDQKTSQTEALQLIIKMVQLAYTNYLLNPVTH